jgi:integrase
VSAIAARLKHFGVFLADIDPGLDSVAALDRRKHIEPYLTSLVDAVSSKNDEPITVADRSRRVLALMGFLTDITEWGWPDAPPRKLVFRDDNPKLPQPLPRYLPVDIDRRLAEVLAEQPGNELAACALRLQRCCGLRIGELLDLELDCVHEVPGHGSWLKIPLGKLETERMVPIDDDILQLIDHIIELRSHGRPMPHPRYRRPAQFLFTHHGRRLSQRAVRDELDRAAEAAGLGHITPHQLRHTYATALVNAGVSLQALMALLGHMSAEMSLRYGRLFDTTVRAEYERALDLAKQQARTPATGRISLPLADITGGADWKNTPLLKSRMAGGFCLRAPAQGACTYANICEHCPSFHTEPSSLPILSAQRVDAEALARDAEQRGWISEAERHKRLITRLDTMISEAQTG